MNGIQLSKQIVRDALYNTCDLQITLERQSIIDIYNRLEEYDDGNDDKSDRIYRLESSENEIKGLVTELLKNVDLKDDRLKEFRLDLETFLENLKAEIGY
jgi:hypothetical protein